MNDSLKDKTYVIAGGSKGIGLSLTNLLLDAGAKVHVYSRTTGDLPVNDQLTHRACDFLDDDFELSELPVSMHGVAYCPGTINLRSFRGLKLDDFRKDFEVNTLGAVKFLKLCLDGLKKGTDISPSSIVLFSTVAVNVGLPMHASIAAAKGAIEGLTRSLAAELASGIRVNCIAPALTDTPLAANLLSTDEKRAAMNAKYPLGRTGKPNDIANLAKFLLSPESEWITGQVIGVDGGMSAIRK